MGRKNHLSRSQRAAASVRSGPAMTAYQAASHTDLALSEWNPFAGSADADLLPELGTLVSRSRDLARNNGLMSGAIQTLRDNIIGPVLRLSANPDYRLLGWTLEQAREWSNNTEAHFRSWAETTECDAACTLNLQGMTLLALSGSMINGDALALPLWLPKPGLRWNTRLSLIESDRLSTPPGLIGMTGMRDGIEQDLYGAPLAYHIQAVHPGDAFHLTRGEAMNLMRWERVPAVTPWGRRRVLHLHDKDRTGQSRGKPLVTAVMREFRMAGQYAQNELEASLANSLVAAFLESNLDPESAGALFGDKPREVWNDSVRQAQQIRKLKGAAIIPLPVGARLNSFTPGRPNVAFEKFMFAVERNIGAGIGLSRSMLLKDFSQSNYSSARAELLEVYRYFHGRRRWLTDYWLRPIYELWLEEAINSGLVDAPGFYENRYAYTRCRFIFGGRGWVDPVKEATASKIRRESMVSTLEHECAEQGFDVEEVLDQLAIEKQMMLDRGLDPNGDTPVTRAAASAPPQNDNENDKNDKKNDPPEEEAIP